MSARGATIQIPVSRWIPRGLRPSAAIMLVGLVAGPVELRASTEPETHSLPAVPAPAPAPRFAWEKLSRKDLPALERLDRPGVLQALDTFDDRGLPDAEFTTRVLGLLNPDRVPGLAEAMAASNPARAVAVVLRACRTHCFPPPGPFTDATRRLADDALENRFTFYGETHQLPAHFSWDANPGTAHWGHDLNRFTYLRPLTEAFLATGDPRYSRKAISLMADWIAQNDIAQCFRGTPYALGSYLNNAIHCTAWVQCLVVLAQHRQVSGPETLRILKSLHDQLAYLAIVTNGHRGNWPTIGYANILQCIAALPILRTTDALADYCGGAMEAQLAAQVLPDGVQYELTPSYHRVVLQNLIRTKLALQALGRELHPETLQTLRRMIRYSQQTAMPDGSRIAAFNDSDPVNVAVEPGPLIAEAGLTGLLVPPDQLGPEVYPYAGVAFLRQRADQGDLYLAFDAGPFGRGHQHEDKLGFWLFAYGRSFLVDPGRHLYDWSEKSFFPYLKSTTAHSTIKVDGLGQFSVNRPETWVAKRPDNLGWSAQPGLVRASGVYDLGYGRNNQVRVIHRREVVFVREKFWIIFDSVEGAGEHTVESRFQFAPGDLTVTGTTAHTDYPDSNLLLVARPARGELHAHVEKGQMDPVGGWYSDRYGSIEPAPALSLTADRGPLPWRSATLLFPYRGMQAPAVEFLFDGQTAEVTTPATGLVQISARF